MTVSRRKLFKYAAPSLLTAYFINSAHSKDNNLENKGFHSDEPGTLGIKKKN